MSIEYHYNILDTGKINFPLKIHFKIKFHLETEMKKLPESRKRVTTIGAPDAKIIFTKAPFIQYEQFLLDKNFRQYIETIMISKKILRMGVQRSPLQKAYEISVGSDSISVEFFGSNRQKHMFYEQSVVWSCNGCSIALLMDYINNPIYQELPDEIEYFAKSDERIYLDLRAS